MDREPTFLQAPTAEELLPTPAEQEQLQRLLDWHEASKHTLANRPLCNHPDGVEAFWHPHRKPTS